MNRAFWEQCLHAWVWLVIGFGLLFSGAGVPGLDGGAGLFYWVVSGGIVDARDFAAPGMRISVSLVGAVMLGWGFAMLAVWRAKGADPVLWRGLAQAVLIWFVVDSALSVMTGFALKFAKIIAVSAVAILAGARKFFRRKPDSPA